jgi:hypothetical protein
MLKNKYTKITNKISISVSIFIIGTTNYSRFPSLSPAFSYMEHRSYSYHQIANLPVGAIPNLFKTTGNLRSRLGTVTVRIGNGVTKKGNKLRKEICVRYYGDEALDNLIIPPNYDGEILFEEFHCCGRPGSKCTVPDGSHIANIRFPKCSFFGKLSVRVSPGSDAMCTVWIGNEGGHGPNFVPGGSGHLCETDKRTVIGRDTFPTGTRGHITPKEATHIVVTECANPTVNPKVILIVMFPHELYLLVVRL